MISWASADEHCSAFTWKKTYEHPCYFIETQTRIDLNSIFDESHKPPMIF